MTRSDTKRPLPDDTMLAAKAAAILGAIFTVFALALVSGRAALSVFIGAAIAVANLVTMRAIIRSLLRGPDDAEGEVNEAPDKDGNAPPPDHAAAGKRGGAAWGVFAVLKILVLFGAIYILLTRGLVDPMALVVGYGVLPLGIAMSSLWSSLGPRR
jgi:hypothetical protein